ncbi:MAG: molybdopterin oxidoreductase family protein [Planctomycetes bacterium]|nr:molybdopterin oxidoreductase family protein [Planctomycetota bacterium]
MARLPVTEESLIEQYGPHLNETPAGGWGAAGEADRSVKTHCCFCGLKCGIQLKVKDNQVVGFEPWEDFPVNRGMLCPKGVKRYLQGGHPDRLLSPLVRTGAGFEPSSWEKSLGLVEAGIRRIQEKHGRDSFAVISGASLTNEKAYLMGKFARVALRTKNIDYNGRLCMVSAGAASRKAFGVDRAANPWSDLPLAKCIIVAGSNIGECFPILTDYLWRARDNGAKIIVIDPRATPIGRTADLLLPVKPGRDSALMNGILHVCIRQGWIDREFIEKSTNGFEALRETVSRYTPERTAEISGVPAESIERAAEYWGTAATGMLLHARGIEHHTKGVENCLTCINLCLATGKIGKPGSGYAMITGQGNGQGGREHGQRCNQLPSGRDIDNPEHRRIVAERWEVPEPEIPGSGLASTEMMEAIHKGEIRGLLSICINPLVSLPDTEYTRAALEKLEFFGVIDFFMSETARHADVVLPGSLQEEDEGTVTTAEGRVVRIRQAVTPPGGAREDWRIICDLARKFAPFEKFPYQCPEDIFRELRRVSQGGPIDYYGMTYDRLEKENGLFWPCPDADHPGTPRLYEGGRFHHADGKAKFHPVEYRPPAEDVDAEYPVILTSGRVVSQYLSGTQTRRIGPLMKQYPEPLVEIHPRLAATVGVRSGDRVTVTSRRGSVTLECQVVKSIRPDTIFIPYHWAGDKSANRLTIRALDPVSKIPEYKVCAVRVEKPQTPTPNSQ